MFLLGIFSHSHIFVSQTHSQTLRLFHDFCHLAKPQTSVCTWVPFLYFFRRAIMIPFSPCQRWWWTFLQIDVFSSQGKMISQAKRHVRSIANFHLWGGMVEWLLVVHNREFPVTPCYQITAQGSHNYWLYTNWDISHYWNKAKDNTRVVVK